MALRRPLQWQGNSDKDLLRFPKGIKHLMGTALLDAQYGDTHLDAKLMRGEFSGVYAIRVDDASGSYRAMYIAKLQHAIYVLQAFRMKSPHGIKIPQKERRVLRQRLRETRSKDARRNLK